MMRTSNHKIKVGLRPTIDGRLGGVRESLESQTLSLAKAAAKLISSSLRHRDGSPLECIIPDKCIGGAAESSETDSLFARENVGLTLTVTPLLVLRLRNDGHGSAPPEGRLGL